MTDVISSDVVTRFAPSPTGFLHIGGARTALFNWLFAKHTGGKFLLRIEDTDRLRSTQEAIDEIIKSLKWLNLDWDGDVCFQFARARRHADVAHDLVKRGKAYYCYCSPEELEEMRIKAKESGGVYKYNGMWRDRDPKLAPDGVHPVVRIKAEQSGYTTIRDLVQGEVKVSNEQLDDMILLRSDGTPTYMLSVVVDDHDMGITHVIRGDDHLTNAFRQIQIYQAMGWDIPKFAHIPLIYGPDGAKLSKRHGALGVGEYKKMGFMPDALCNYLMRLGWSHGDDEIISRKDAIDWFTVDKIGKSPARFDFNKLTNLNAHYIRHSDNKYLMDYLSEFRAMNQDLPFNQTCFEMLSNGMNGLKQRAKTIIDLNDSCEIYTSRPKLVNFQTTLSLELKHFVEELQNTEFWDENILEKITRDFCKVKNIKLTKLAEEMRLLLTGRNITPSIFEIMNVLGKKESLERINNGLTNA